MSLSIVHTDVIKALNHQLDAQWREFGTFLYVEPAIMNEISLHKSNVAACMELLVEKWLYHENGTGDLPRTWKTVVQAVNDVGKRLLAQQLAKHIPPSTSVSTDFSGSSLATSVHRNLLYSPQRKTGNKINCLYTCLGTTTSLPSFTDSHSMLVACIYV